MENMEVIRQFFEGKRILVTGHTGFKGTWLTSMLKYWGAEIYGYALPGSETEFYHSANTGVHSYWGDVRDGERIKEVMQECRPEIVIHLASHSTVNQGQEITHYIFETNMMGVVNLFEAIRTVSSVKAVLVVTSDKCYKNQESDVPYAEDCVFGAQDPYSASKAVQELISECYRNTFFQNGEVAVATARASNVIGGGDFNRSRLFPSLIHSFIQGETAVIRNPNAIRPWQNVLDVLHGYLLLIMKLYQPVEQRKEYCSGFNFGPEEENFVTVREVAELLQEKFLDGKYMVAGENTVTETKILKLDSTRAKEKLQWRQKYSLKETVYMTAEFEQRFVNGDSAEVICRNYICDYYGG